jgi:hypothetical protein
VKLEGKRCHCAPCSCLYALSEGWTWFCSFTIAFFVNLVHTTKDFGYFNEHSVS